MLCNTKIKWSVLEQRARLLGADYLATGHYARTVRDPSRNCTQLLRGVDQKRDQSYFLWGVESGSLARTIFPLGDLCKDEVREIARDLGLRNAERPESREICFVPDNDYGRFLKEKGGVTVKPGAITDPEGRTVGKHDGVAFYTIGQRKGLGAHGKPSYVTGIDPQNNVVRIGADELLYRREFTVGDLNWISINPPASRIPASVKIRYRHRAVPAEIIPDDEQVRICFAEPQRAITPGQSAVFYDGDIVLGGGRIKQVRA